MDLQNNNNLKGHYPLYLGGELGLIDNIHETYPQVAKLRDELYRNKWDWREISLAKDARDIVDPTLAAGTKAMTRNLAYQFAADSLVCSSVIQVMGNFCSNPELLGLLQELESNEYVHAMQYSEIAKKAYLEPQELLEEIKSTEPLLDRLRPVADVLEATEKMSHLYALGLETDETRLRRQIIKYHAAVLALEGIGFAGSFAATFGVAKAYKSYEGIKNSVQLITRDELDIHVNIGMTILKILKEEWPEEYAAVLPEIRVMYDTVLKVEDKWLDYMFDGVTVRGLNKELLSKYIYFLAFTVYSAVFDEHDIEQTPNPLPWMSEYTNLGDIQVAAQETQLVNYNVNIINDDVSDDDDLDVTL